MTDPTPTYDEFSLFHENAEEVGLPYDGRPVVRRESIEVAPGRLDAKVRRRGTNARARFGRHRRWHDPERISPRLLRREGRRLRLARPLAG